MRELTLDVISDPSREGSPTLIATGLGRALCGELSRVRATILSSILKVTVITDEQAGAGLPDVSGEYRLLEDGIEFVPHFPFEAGVKYRVSFDARAYGCERPEAATLDFSFPARLPQPLSEVSRLFPSGKLLPENLLRFYVHFSHAMQRGQAEKEIALIDSDGRPVADALYRAPLELWDRSMRRLTVLLDPGRLKRWVGPNAALGPPIQEGREYVLEIGSGMVDEYSRQLGQPFQKRFRVSPPVRNRIEPSEWQTISPRAGGCQPLTLTFPIPLDFALLSRAIAVQSNCGYRIAGDVVIENDERTWKFTPASPWVPGEHWVRVASDLEDVCGNSLAAPFDRPIRRGTNLVTEASDLSFTFRAS